MKILRLIPIALLAACGARPQSPAATGPVIEMEPVVLEVEEGSDGKVRAIDAAGLFEDGQDAFARQDFPACDRAFEDLIDRFPTSRYVHSALYNRGLCLEQLGQHARAASLFRRYAQLAQTLKDKRDGQFRWGYNLVKSGDDPTAISLYTDLLGADDLGDADRAECHLRRGISRMNLAKHGLAERDFKASMSYTKQAYDDMVRGNELFAEAHFRRGELYQKLAHRVRLKLPVGSMKKTLREKVRFFRQSQSSYIDTLNVRHTYWATAAGMKLGELYEQFYLDVLAAEVPDDFDHDTKYYYVLELKKELQPLLEQSLAIYEKNITMSERLGAENEWVKETEHRLVRLRTLIEENQKAVDEAPNELPTAAEKPKPGRS